MGGTETPHLYDFGIFGRVPEPQNQLYLSLETPGHLNQIKKTPGTFLGSIIVIHRKKPKMHYLAILKKTAAGKYRRSV